eukprot:snap_masked-scaffold_20-processed-gene-1.6-mRNA-1 protein AED:1.00 eAED:1.00 QI:0/-1/0/0/-1/1/1/0/182
MVMHHCWIVFIQSMGEKTGRKRSLSYLEGNPSVTNSEKEEEKLFPSLREDILKNFTFNKESLRNTELVTEIVENSWGIKLEEDNVAKLGKVFPKNLFLKYFPAELKAVILQSSETMVKDEPENSDEESSLSSTEDEEKKLNDNETELELKDERESEYGDDYAVDHYDSDLDHFGSEKGEATF